MRHVQGIGKSAEKATDFTFPFAVHHAAGTNINNQRKHNDNAKSFV